MFRQRMFKALGLAFTAVEIEELGSRIVNSSDAKPGSPYEIVVFDCAMGYTGGMESLQVLQWPEAWKAEGCEVCKRRWFILYRVVISPNETPKNYKQLTPDLKNEEEKKGYDWLKSFNYSDEEISRFWFTAPENCFENKIVPARSGGAPVLQMYKELLEEMIADRTAGGNQESECVLVFLYRISLTEVQIDIGALPETRHPRPRLSSLHVSCSTSYVIIVTYLFKSYQYYLVRIIMPFL